MGAAMFDEALHVAQRIAEKQADLVGEGVLSAKPFA